VSQRSTAAITCRGQRYGRASGGLLHAKPHIALPTLAVDSVVVARRLIGKVMTVGAQAIGSPVVQGGVGSGGLSVDHFAIVMLVPWELSHTASDALGPPD